MPNDRKEKLREYYLKNRERIKEKSRLRWQRIKDDEKLRIKRQLYYDAHKIEKRKRCEQPKYRYAESLRRAKRGNIEHDLSLLEYQQIIQCGLCHYCGKDIEKVGSGLDRKDSGKGYSFDNCVPCCKRCNFTFNALYDYEEKLILAEAIKRIDLRRDKCFAKESTPVRSTSSPTVTGG
jgi:hypothetical protein